MSMLYLEYIVVFSFEYFVFQISHYFDTTEPTELDQELVKIGPIDISVADIKTLDKNISGDALKQLTSFRRDRKQQCWEPGWLNDQVIGS